MTGKQCVVMQQKWPIPDGFRLDAFLHSELGSGVTGI